MRTESESLLMNYDRAVLDEWVHESGAGGSHKHRIARELSRLEQENTNHRKTLSDADEAIRKLGADYKAHVAVLGQEYRQLRDEHADIATTRDALTAARAEVQRLRDEIEKDQAARVEWQRSLDHLESDNARIRNQLRLALILSEPGKVDHVMERIEKLEARSDIELRSQVATLEGRLQGVTETVKLELALLRNRADALEDMVR